MTYSVSLKTKPYIEAIANIFREEVLDEIETNQPNSDFKDELEIFKNWFLEELIGDITGFIDQKANILGKMYPAEREFEHE